MCRSRFLRRARIAAFVILVASGEGMGQSSKGSLSRAGAAPPFRESGVSSPQKGSDSTGLQTSSASGALTNAAPAVRLPDESHFAQGRYVYERTCLVCHGKWGDGRGELGLQIQPRPRKFTAGVFKYRTTPTGSLPTDADLKRTVRQGIYGTAMPAFASLAARELDAVVEYVKGFSSKWRKPENYAAPIEIPRPPEWFGDSSEFATHAISGRTLFATSCAPCHGEHGQGDGPAAAHLTDDWDQPVKPADLSPPSLRSGPEVSDIYKVIVTGLNGTPMPSFLGTTTEEERWDLVAFIESLRRTDRLSFPPSP